MRSVEAQLLHRPPGLGAGDIVSHLLAVQAQDVTAARLAFRARSETLTVAEIDAAWHAGEMVRTWGPRGTLHFMHADDLPWLLSLTARLVNPHRRLEQEGVHGDDLLELITRTMAGQGPLTKSELEERLAGRARGQGVVHLVALAAAQGLAVLAPPRAGKPTYVHAADWLGAPIAFDHDKDRALAELARRYRRSHHPATAEDLAAWSGLPLGEARTAWAATAAPSAAVTEPTSSVRLAPAFDEWLLGWRSRDAILADEHAAKVFPGGGILRPVVLVDGTVRGTWSRQGARVTVTPFGDLPPVDAELADIRRFLAG